MSFELIPNVENRVLVCDLEANGLSWELDRLWCIAAIDFDTEEEFFWGPDEVKTGLKNLMEAKKIVFHNFYGFDHVAIKKLYPRWSYKDSDDTLIMSCLFDADRDAPPGISPAKKHSIEAWGLRFGREKPEHEDWTQYSEEMKHRCLEDTWIGLMTYKALLEEAKGWDWDKALRLEYKVAEIHGWQTYHGVYFDTDKAESLYNRLQEEIKDIEEKLYAELPLRPTTKGKEVSKPFKKDGNYSKMVEDWMGGEVNQVCGAFCKVKWEEFNLNSHDQIKEYLLANGWQPTQWNYKKDGKYFAKDEQGNKIKSSPKLTEDSFDSIEGEIPKLITKRAVLVHRAQMIKHEKKDGTKTGWLNKLREDRRIVAGGLTNGTPTGRYKHFGLVNVPKPTKDKETGELVFDTDNQNAIYGTQLRDLFTVPKGKKMVGCDASGLEARMEAHHCYNFHGGQDYAKELMEGDVHQRNAEIWECERDEAKSPKYALTYGCQPPKLADTMGIPVEDAEKWFNQFWEGNTALRELKDALEVAFKRRYSKKTKRSFVKGLDGRKLWIRSKHALVNTLFQSSGSICVKTAFCFVWTWIQEEGLDAWPVIMYHDEFEWEVAEKDAERVAELCQKSFQKAGEFWKLNVPLDGDPIVDYTWARVH